MKRSTKIWLHDRLIRAIMFVLGFEVCWFGIKAGWFTP